MVSQFTYLRSPTQPASSRDSGWFTKLDDPEVRTPTNPPVSGIQRRTVSPVREETDLIGIETSKARRYSYIAPRSGKRLGHR